MKKIKIRLYRPDVEEIYRDGVLIGYMNYQSEIPKTYMFDTYDVVVQET